MPPSLPSSVFLVGAFRKMTSITKTTLRTLLVVIVWLIFVPFLTTCFWNLYFNRDRGGEDAPYLDLDPT